MDARKNLRVLIYITNESLGLRWREVLQQAGFDVHLCRSRSEACLELESGAGVVLADPDEWSDERMNQTLVSGIPWLVFGRPSESTKAIQRLGGGVTHVADDVQSSVLVELVLQALNSRQLQQRLCASRRDAEQAERAKTAFLANIHHEFRTPLGAIMGFSELALESGISADERRRCDEAIRRNGQKLLTLMDNLLDLARIETGHFTLQAQEFSLRQVLKDVLGSLKTRSFHHELHLQIHNELESLDRFSGDEDRIRQVVFHILENAIKFSPSGPIYVRVTKLAQTGREAMLAVQVEDNGPGIPIEVQAQLFRAFSQADSTCTRNTGGVGIGLALSRALARVLGGDLTLKWSSPGRGSCFQIVFTARAVEEAAAYTVHADLG